MRGSTPSNSDDILDSGSVDERIAELEGERESLADDVTTATEESQAIDQEELGMERRDALEAAEKSLQEWDDDNGDELKHLIAFREEADSSEWRYGVTLIRETHFEQYARDFAEDIGAMKDCDKWPATCIDWKEASSELQQDFTGADFDGVTYYFQG